MQSDSASIPSPEGGGAADRRRELPALVTLVVLSFALIACGKEPARVIRTIPPESTRAPVAIPAPQPPSAAVSSPPPTPAAPEPDDRPCAHPKAISPSKLAATWPSKIGQCVRLSTRIVRSIDVTRALVQGEGAAFIVWMSPGAAWVGLTANTFVVMGSASVPLHGRTTLPELMLQVPDDAMAQGVNP